MSVIPIVIVGLDWDIVDLIESSKHFLLRGMMAPAAPPTGPDYLGTDLDWPELSRNEPMLQAIVAVDIPALRRRLTAHYGTRVAGVVSPIAYVASTAHVDGTSLIQRNVTIMPMAHVAEGVKLNVGCALHHEVRVGAFSTIAPGARLLGKVHVSAEVFVGASATILPGCKIGQGATIGAGSVVTKDVAPGSKVVGVPARAIA